MTEDHARTPLPELEALLRGGDLPPARRQAIEAELNRRYAEKWRASAAPGVPSAPSPPPPGQQHPPPPGPPQPQPPVWGPPVPAAVRPAKTSGLAKPLGCLAAVLVAALAAVVVAVLVDSESSPPPRIGTVCVTQFGTCPMADSLPVGQSCVCRTADGDIAGVVA